MGTVTAICVWLFVAECTTADSLLSLGFAINIAFMGLSLSRFNLCERIKNVALKCLESSTGANFLQRLEHYGKGNKEIGKRLKKYSDLTSGYSTAMRNRSKKWEIARLSLTFLCAFASFVLLAFEVKTRIGLVLGLSYIVILFAHALYVLIYTARVWWCYRRLIKAMDKVERENQPTFDMAECIESLKANHKALSPSP